MLDLWTFSPDQHPPGLLSISNHPVVNLTKVFSRCAPGLTNKCIELRPRIRGNPRCKDNNLRGTVGPHSRKLHAQLPEADSETPEEWMFAGILLIQWPNTQTQRVSWGLTWILSNVWLETAPFKQPPPSGGEKWVRRPAGRFRSLTERKRNQLLAVIPYEGCVTKHQRSIVSLWSIIYKILWTQHKVRFWSLPTNGPICRSCSLSVLTCWWCRWINYDGLVSKRLKGSSSEITDDEEAGF